MVFGEYEYMQFDPRVLIVLPQTRKKKNPRFDDIAQSILMEGLINPIDVARLTYEEFKAHATFLNELWKSDIDVDSYKPIDGYYYVVIAGHTRLGGMKKIVRESDEEVTMFVKIHKAKTSDQIMAIQVNENIHSEPDKEEIAIAIIGTYRAGLKLGRWRSKEEFIEDVVIKGQRKKIGSKTFDEALIFADLPFEIAEYIFKGYVPYSVGVELGRIFPLIESYERAHVGDGQLLEECIRLRYGKMINKILQVRGIKKAFEAIKGETKLISDYFRPQDEVQQDLFDYWNDGPERQREMYLKSLLSEYAEAYTQLYKIPFKSAEELLGLDRKLTGIDHSGEIQHVKSLLQNFRFESARVIESKVNV